MAPFSWKCEKCGKILNHVKSVARHKKSHLEEKIQKFDCERCSKSFARKENLTRHYKTCKTKKFDRQCNICLKSFKEPWQMKRHLKTHINKKTVKCNNCGSWIKGDFESHSVLCLREKAITSEELEKEYPSMVPITRYTFYS